jgi:hypothetical protein
MFWRMDVQGKCLGPDQILRQILDLIKMFQPFSTWRFWYIKAGNRANQDVGLDGLSNADEGSVYTHSSEFDPAADDYSFI